MYNQQFWSCVMKTLFILFVLTCTFTPLTRAICLLGKWHIIVTNDISGNDVIIHVKSGDEDRGIQTIPFHGTFDWTFCERINRGSLYFASFSSGSKSQTLNLFDEPVRHICAQPKPGTQHCYWSVRPDGFFVSHRPDGDFVHVAFWR